MAQDTPVYGNKHVDEFFRVSISGGGYNIIAEMPEELNVNVEQDWENPFKIVLNDKVQGAYQLIANVAGFERNTLLWNYDQLFTYMGGSPMQLSFEIVFTAHDSVNLNIVEPIKALMKLASPGEGQAAAGNRAVGQVLPEADLSRVRQLTKPPGCTIYFGKILKLQNVIITSVNPQITRPFVSGTNGDFEGAPMRVPVNLTIQTKFLMTQRKVEDIFFKG